MHQTTPNSQNFPQFSQAKISNRFTPIAKTQIEDYKISPAVQNRPTKIVAIEKEESGIRLTFSTSARSAILSYTHETALHLYFAGLPEDAQMLIWMEITLALKLLHWNMMKSSMDLGNVSIVLPEMEEP